MDATAGGGGDALGGQATLPGDVDWKSLLPGEMGELADRAQKRAEERKRRSKRREEKAAQEQLAGAVEQGPVPLEAEGLPPVDKGRPRKRRDKKKKKDRKEKKEKSRPKERQGSRGSRDGVAVPGVLEELGLGWHGRPTR